MCGKDLFLCCRAFLISTILSICDCIGCRRIMLWYIAGLVDIVNFCMSFSTRCWNLFKWSNLLFSNCFVIHNQMIQRVRCSCYKYLLMFLDEVFKHACFESKVRFRSLDSKTGSVWYRINVCSTQNEHNLSNMQCSC